MVGYKEADKVLKGCHVHWTKDPTNMLCAQRQSKNLLMMEAITKLVISAKKKEDVLN